MVASDPRMLRSNSSGSNKSVSTITLCRKGKIPTVFPGDLLGKFLTVKPFFQTFLGPVYSFGKYFGVLAYASSTDAFVCRFNAAALAIMDPRWKM